MVARKRMTDSRARSKQARLLFYFFFFSASHLCNLLTRVVSGERGRETQRQQQQSRKRKRGRGNNQTRWSQPASEQIQSRFIAFSKWQSAFAFVLLTHAPSTILIQTLGSLRLARAAGCRYAPGMDWTPKQCSLDGLF